MTKALAKLGFHLALYATRLLPLPRLPQPAPTPPERQLAGTGRIFFWTPGDTAGANVIVHDIMPALCAAAAQHAPGWTITAGHSIPDGQLDALISFKAVPPPETRLRASQSILLICDQAEVFWHDIPGFDSVVATSSEPFAALLRHRHPRVTFIPESEPLDYIESGATNLRLPPSQRPPELIWHGGHYSLGALLGLRPQLERWAKGHEATLQIISGGAPASQERWGELRVQRSPWSKAHLKEVASRARLGLVPARTSLKSSWLKPASRVRCLFALGVPAIGDSRVPDVHEFAAACRAPVAGSDAEWLLRLQELWNDPTELDALAERGHRAVADRWSANQTAFRWLRHLDAEFTRQPDALAN